MAEQPEARIVIRHKGRQAELSVYEPRRGREHRTGWHVAAGQVEASVRKLREQLERAGNRVTIKEM